MIVCLIRVHQKFVFHAFRSCWSCCSLANLNNDKPDDKMLIHFMMFKHLRFQVVSYFTVLNVWFRHSNGKNIHYCFERTKEIRFRDNQHLQLKTSFFSLVLVSVAGSRKVNIPVREVSNAIVILSLKGFRLERCDIHQVDVVSDL